jgi:hypothetical protein
MTKISTDNEIYVELPESNFKTTIPDLNPLSTSYIKFWKEQKQRCINGWWVDNVYIPGILYFYINFWTIKLQKGKSEIKGSPYLRDIEWFKGKLFMVARGFSGFELDKEYTCEDIYKDNPHPTKKYMDPLEYLSKRFDKPLGNPQYLNQAKNVVEIGGRGYGKSYLAACFIGYTFIFDGATNYEELLASKGKANAVAMVGAIDSKYSKKLMDKVEIGLDNLPGDIEFNGKLYRCPLAKSYDGSFTVGKGIKARTKVKQGGTWTTKGTNSEIIHVSFADNPEAANGNRIAFVALEEIGFMGNLLPTLGNLVDCTSIGGNKFGTVWMFGTGGDMDGGSTEAVKEVFYDPAAYECVVFPDNFEHKGSIGLFVPAYYKYDKYRNKLNIVDKTKGVEDLMKKREVLAKANDKEPLNRELQNNPIIPSEAFLVTSGNVFPVSELKDHLAYLESEVVVNDDVKGTIGSFRLQSHYEAVFEPDMSNKLRPCKFPIKETDDKTGCVTIWEHPIDNPPYGMYLAGTDPYDQDEAPNTVSVGSTFILKRTVIGLSSYDQVVAEYTGRPGKVEEHHETVRRLLLYYNARNLYENERNSLKMHFEHKNSLHLLLSEPTVLKSTANSNVSRKYGIHMTRFIKEELEIYTRDWLMEPVEGKDRLNLHYIYSIPLLKELVMYNNTGNFDRVIAFMLSICAKLQFNNIQSIAKNDESKKDMFKFFDRKLWTN